MIIASKIWKGFPWKAVKSLQLQCMIPTQNTMSILRSHLLYEGLDSSFLVESWIWLTLNLIFKIQIFIFFVFAGNREIFIKYNSNWAKFAVVMSAVTGDRVSEWRCCYRRSDRGTWRRTTASEGRPSHDYQPWRTAPKLFQGRAGRSRSGEGITIIRTALL